MVLAPMVDPADLDLYRAGDSALLVRQAEALVRAYCGWHIAPSLDETLTLYGNRASLYLPSTNVTAVSSVTDSGTVVSTDVYRLRGDRLERTSGWWSRRTPVTVTLTHGFDTVPADVQQVVLDVANRAQGAAKSGAYSRLRVGDVDRQLATGGDGAAVSLTEANKDALAPYRILAFA